VVSVKLLRSHGYFFILASLSALVGFTTDDAGVIGSVYFLSWSLDALALGDCVEGM